MVEDMYCAASLPAWASYGTTERNAINGSEPKTDDTTGNKYLWGSTIPGQQCRSMRHAAQAGASRSSTEAQKGPIAERSRSTLPEWTAEHDAPLALEGCQGCHCCWSFNGSTGNYMWAAGAPPPAGT